MVSTHPKNISQIGSFPQGSGWKEQIFETTTQPTSTKRRCVVFSIPDVHGCSHNLNISSSHAKTTRFEGRIKSVSGEKLPESTHAVRIQQMLLCIIQGDFGGNRFPQKTCSTRNCFFATACVDTNGCGRSGRYLREIAINWVYNAYKWRHKWVTGIFIHLQMEL